MGVNKIIDLCYKICNVEQKDSWCHIDGDFILYSVKDGEEFVQIDALNRSHTALFKIRAKRSDLGLIFKYPCWYNNIDASLRKWKLRRMDLNNISDRIYIDLLKFDDVFNLEYDYFDYSDLRRLLDTEECGQIEIRNNGFYNIYSSDLIDSVLIDDDLENVSLKLMGRDMPLRLNYQYGAFDVYCLIAPRIHVKEDRFFLRV